MKKVLCFILCFVLLITVFVPTEAYAMRNDLSIYIASDIHYKPYSSLVPVNEKNSLPNSELYSHTNTKGMLTYEADAVIDGFLKDFENSDSDILLIPGDISEDGFWDEHLAIAEKLREFQNRTGKKIFLIPGNHDIRTSKSKNRLNLSDFLDIYADIGFDECLERHENSASYTVDLNDEYRLLAIDACIYRQDGAEIYPELYEWIENQVAIAQNNNKKLIGMVHHSVLEHFSIEGIAGNLLCVDGYRDFASQLADWGIKYVFTGHGHANDISTAISKNGNRIYDIETCSLITYPNAYRNVTFSDDGVNIKTLYVDKIDTSLLPDGFTKKQIEMMENDFPSYSLGYFRAGMESYAYEVDFLTNKISGKLDIEDDSPAYNILAEVVSTLGDALKLPLYDEEKTDIIDSIEEVALLGDVALEKSNYANVLDIAGMVYAGHYKGNENYSFESTEITLLMQGLNATLVYALLKLPVNALNSLVKELNISNKEFEVSDNIYTYASKIAYVKTIAKAIILEVIKPLADGIINDWSAPDDIDVSLEPYDETIFIFGQSVAISNASLTFRIIRQIVEIVLNIIKTLFTL